MACVTCVSAATAALVVVGELDAVKTPGGVARAGQALVDVALTVLAREARRARAGVAADAVHTLPTVLAARALVGRTLVQVFLTLGT